MEKPVTQQDSESGSGDTTVRQSIAAWTGAGLFAVLALVSAFAPSGWRLWGFDGLAYLPTSARWIWPAAALLISLLLYWTLRRGPGFSGSLLPVLILAAALFASVLLADATSLRGDGILLSSDISAGKIPRLRAPLMMLLIRGSFAIRGGTLPVKPFFRVCDAFAFLLYLTAAWILIRRLSGSSAKIIAAIALGFSGAMLASGGLVEYYAFAYATAALGLVTALGEIERSRFPWKGTLLLLLATGFHLVAATMLPAVILTLAPRWGRRRTMILFAVLGLAGLAAFTALMRHNLLYPLGPLPGDGYTIWSMRHWADLFNLLGWALPVAFFVLVPCLLLGGKLLKSETEFLFLAGATLGTLAFALIFSPDLGMARDADLIGFVAVPGTLLAIHLLARENAGISRNIASAALFVALIGPAAQLYLHAHDIPSAQRFVRMLRRDSYRSPYGWESLAIFLRWRGDTFGELQAYKEAWKLTPNWRYAYQIATITLNHRDFSTARSYAEILIRDHPDLPDGYWLLGSLNVQLGHHDEGKRLLQESINRNSTLVTPYSMLAYLLTEEKDYLQAEQLLVLASRHAQQLDGLYYAVFTIVEERLGKSSAALRLYENTSGKAIPSPLKEEAEAAYRRAREKLQNPVR